ncbi:MAG: PAS domain S-box protein, partial [Desulfobacteraceae bacterium]|nr:PAS domain S-box protein [Desulfobacteraceae bacterium]
FTLAFDTVHPDEREDHLASNQKAFHDRKPFIWEGRFIIDGELCWLHVESTPEVFANGDTRWFGIIQDITERKQAEEKLIEREALFRGMFNDHSAVMLLIDPNTGQIIKANQAAVQYY